MKRGILLIAVGHESYIQMARNLMVSIRVNDPGLQIALATDQSSVSIEPELYDQLVRVPESCYKHKGKTEWIKVKTHMYDLSPFEETIFLDVDMIMLPKRQISVLFDQLQDLYWTIANTGLGEISVWADIDEVKQAYHCENPFYNYHSEFVYFKKCKEAKLYFKTVKEVFNNPKVTGTVFGGARIADELAFQIASIILDMYPHQDNFTPTFWWARDKRTAFQYLYQINPAMVSYSIGGHNLPNHVRDNYNNLASVYFNQLSLQSPYQARPKKLFLKERQKI